LKLHQTIDLLTHRQVQDTPSFSEYCSFVQSADRFLPMNVSGHPAADVSVSILTFKEPDDVARTLAHLSRRSVETEHYPF
jgi:hypothetical protein